VSLKDPIESTEEFDLYEFHGTEEPLRDRYKHYLKYFSGANLPILDIGCGRGTMLSLLQENNIRGYGVDASEQSIKICREKGLDVFLDDALNHLKGLKSDSLGGIFCAHIIEHLYPQTAFKMLKECYRTLSPSMPLIVLTPTAIDLLVMTRCFWMDLTHVRPYPAELLLLMLRKAGFSKVEVGQAREPSLGKRIRNLIANLWFLGLFKRGELKAIAFK
jgi:2-polyprenyl-3-methyl-5-hydroxy-6-metoxy-1,4-benzoquinol methylase